VARAIVRALLDTHAFLWWLDGDRRLSRRARQVIQNEASRIWVSAVSAWEIVTKHRLGRLPGAADVAADVGGAAIQQGFELLDISVLHAQHAGRLGGSLKDPWDLMLIAQSQIEGIPLISNEEGFDSYGISRVW
jgi:PIN domain nuclease of toxin-antitoxin system